jgi:peptidase S41-like protein
VSPRAREAAERPLPGGMLLADFLRVEPLPGDVRYLIVEQALALLEGAYVHLRLKRAMYGIDPIQRLRLLFRRLDTMSDAQFHGELSAIFRSLRDLHTVYQLPDPYRGHVAVLGFLVERYVAADGPHYVVTKSHEELRRRGLEPGVEVVAWNGIPISRAVELNADRQSGSNPDARLARGLEALTLRSLRTGTPPDERWVIVEYRKGRSRSREIRVPWSVMAAGTTVEGHPQEPVSAISGVLGIDTASESTRQIKRGLFAMSDKAKTADAFTLRSILRTDTIPLGGREYGYLRLFSFNISSARRFLEAVSKLLALLPQAGLVVDIRANPGGSIPAAEGLLQLLSTETVDPALFSLATTPLALALCDSNPSLRHWSPSINAAVETGEPYSQPFLLTDAEALTDGLTRYSGPVVLVTDALCYSAADIFAAGFQDNEIGQILGTATRTGAGGANVWTHDLLRLWLPDQLKPLPLGASFRVAIRRATRVRAQQSVPLEDLGVSADTVHELTKRDLVADNQDLRRKAAELLAAA